MASWTFGLCEPCLKNAHEKVKMKRITVESTDEKKHWFRKMWCCPACGSCKEL